ncbi:MAG: hypothetical protein NZ108_02545 [Bacteroidia bacterium]|nr:hypothetical protein [Bacteroidia bacterium]
MEDKTKVGLRKPGSPYSEAECEEIIAKLELLLDGELDPEKQKEVEQMVNDCEYCLEQYKIEKSFRKLLKTGFSNFFDSSSLLSSIKQKINSLRKD